MTAAMSLPSLEDHFIFFTAVYRVIQKHLLDETMGVYEMDACRRSYLEQMMDATCLGGKYNRGLTVLGVVSDLLGDEKTEEMMFLAAVGGWMVEMLQAHFLIEDDIMDSSVTRRGKPCWYRYPGVTTQSAINDGLIVLAWANELASHYFEGRSCLPRLLRLFSRTNYCTTIGQFYDVTSMRDGENMLDPTKPQQVTTTFKEFTMENYRRVVKHKTAFYTYHLPLAMGLCIAGQEDSVPRDLLERTSVKMGEYFQAQDDFMDCYTDPALLGKVGTDIEDMKCSWLAVSFLDCASEEDKEQFHIHYGKNNEEDVAVIKKLYNKVGLSQKFLEYEKDCAEQIENYIEEIKIKNPHFAVACTKIWLKTYKRTK